MRSRYIFSGSADREAGRPAGQQTGPDTSGGNREWAAYFITFLFLMPAWISMGQDNIVEAKFHQGSNLFINGNPESALTAVNEGLRAAPGNEKLTALKKLLEEEKKKQEQQKKEQKEQEQKEKQQQQQQEKKDQENKENKDQENKEEQKKDEQNKDQQDKEKKDPKDAEKKEQEKKEQEQKESKKKEDQKLPPEVLEKLKDMKISEEKAKMILEAMKNQEIQYLQQNKREATQPRDRGKPDW